MTTITTRSGKGAPLTNAELDANFTALNAGKLETTATTTSIAEGTNQYFTNARARAAISATGSLSYNATTGVMSFTQGNTDTVTEGTTNLYFTNARARAAISSTTGVAGYNSTTGVITIPGTTAHITEGSNLYYTDARARAALSASTGISYNSTTGAISSTITQYTDALARAAVSFTAGSGAYNSTTGVFTIPTNTSHLTNGAGFITSSASISGNAATATNISNSGTVTLATATEQNSITITQPTYSTDTPVKLLNFDWYNNVMSIGAIRTGNTASNGLGVYYTASGGSRIEVARFGVTGNFTAVGSVAAYSDERLKKDWTSVGAGFVEKLAEVKSGTYTRVDNDQRQAGVSAQSLQEVLPETVLEDVEGYLSVSYGNAALVAAIELAKEVKNLKARLEQLEAR